MVKKPILLLILLCYLFSAILTKDNLVNTDLDKTSNSSFRQLETIESLELKEKEIHHQYLLEGNSMLFTINIQNYKETRKIHIDLIIYTGDANMDMEGEELKRYAHKYYLSNKIFFSIAPQNGLTTIPFTVTAFKNTYFTLLYETVKYDDKTEITNEIQSGLSFIAPVYMGEDYNSMKYIKIKNTEYSNKTPFLINFYSQNCRFLIYRIIDENENVLISKNDEYTQLIIDQNDKYGIKEENEFEIYVLSDDISSYNKKLCMFYISGLEIIKKTDDLERSILVSEGIPQYYLFTKDYPSIKYSFYISDRNNQLVFSFNLIDKSTFKVIVYHDNKPLKNREIYRNDQIFITKDELEENCVENETCKFDVYIELTNLEKEKRVETTIYQVNGAPIYLEKNVIKQDILLSSMRKKYFLDVGKNEEGDITIDYIRGSGYIYATVVSKNNPEPIEYPEWRGMYRFPRDIFKSMNYDTYLKKIQINKNETEICEDGCYILISVENSVFDPSIIIDGNSNLVPFRITITPRILQKDDIASEEYSIPKVMMRPNQFVIGNILNTTDTILTYYEVILPFESEYIIFDWQADKPSLFIDIGEERPSIKDNKHDFELKSVGHDTVYKITKEQIITKAYENYNLTISSLRNLHLTLGIWTDTIDTLYTSVYAFKIFMPPVYNGPYEKKVVEIIHIRSDQKVQCLPYLEENTISSYSCLFAVIFDEGDDGKTLIVYPRAQMENLKVTYKGALVDAERIEKNDMKYIVEEMEKPADKFYSEKSKYLYVEKIDRKYCLLFSVNIDRESIIEVLSSIYTYDENQVFVPNPSTPQVFAIGEKKILFNFETTKDLLINIVGINGAGVFYWQLEEEKNIRYFMDGFEDRLTLTSGTYEKSLALSNLVCQSATFTGFQPDNSGFVFYISFYPRNHFYNFDQVKVGRSTEINYRHAEFPLNFFARLTDKDIAISFTFYNYFMEKNKLLEYDKPLFNIWGKIITEKDALNARMDGNRIPKKEGEYIYGVFDGAFGTLFLNASQIEKFNVKDEENPFLFFSVEMKDQKVFEYNGISMEVSILREQTEKELDYFAPEYVYLNGKLANNNRLLRPRFVYKLRTDIKFPYMKIEFASNSDLVKWDIGYDSALTESIPKDNLVFKNGRFELIFSVPYDILQRGSPLYFVIYNDDYISQINPKLTNYVFRYMNGDSINSFFNFLQEKDNLEYSITNGNNNKRKYTISFYPIENFEVNYFIKAVYRDTKLKGEIENTIAISESDGYYIQIDNPEFDEQSGKKYISFEIDQSKEISYIKVLAKVNFFTIKEYLLYKPIYVYEDDKFPEVATQKVLEFKSLLSYKYNTAERQIKLECQGAPKIQKYEISFENNEFPNYVQVQIKSEDNSKNKIIYFSPNNEDAKEDRIQLTQIGIEKEVTMWIKKDELSKSSLYVTVECQIGENEKCDYNINFIGYKFAVIDSLVFNYNYYVNKNNKRMEFAIKNRYDSSEIDHKVLTLYANGGKEINLTLVDCNSPTCNQNKFRTGTAITTKMISHNYFEFIVEAEEGDYISVGSKVTSTTGKSEENILTPNGYQFTGFLKKLILESECYSLENIKAPSYIVAMFYNVAAQITYKDKSFKDVEVVTYNEGYYSHVFDPDKEPSKKYICIELPNINVFIVGLLPYSIQLTQQLDNIGSFNFYPPQLSGNIYPRIIHKNSYAFFTGANLKVDSNDIIYNMIALEGSPKMYIYKCTDYPICNFDFEQDEVIKTNEINHMSTWHNKQPEKNNSPIDKTQYIMIVKCENKENTVSDTCQFQTSIYGNKDYVYLYEGQSYSQYILAGNEAHYIIDFSLEQYDTKIHIDTLVVSGDVNYVLRNERNEEVASNKYYLANKIFYSIHLTDRRNYGLTKVFVDVTAKVNSYYIIEFKVVRGEISEISNKVYEGINYLISVSPNVGQNKKIISVHNSKLFQGDNYLVNFYSLNCDFIISKLINEEEEKAINSYDTYAQDFITDKDELNNNFFNYQLTAVNTDPSYYENNMCMIYVSGLEITQDSNANEQKEILIGEGIPQKVTFDNGLKRIKYVYPVPDKEKNVAIYFKVIHSANYSYSITVNDYTIIDPKPFYQSFVLYEDKLVINGCGENDLCNLMILITLNEKVDLVPVLQVTLRQIDNVPHYIPKEEIVQDFLSSKSTLRLFTTLGKNDEGYITFDFARSSGMAYAKIVKFDDKDNDPDWRQYKFPSKVEESLYYEFYNKKIQFNSSHTSECEDGCYLLISLTPSAKGKLDEQYRFHPLSITVALTNGDSPIIKIEPDYFIVGSLANKDKIKKKDMYEYYQMDIPFDAYKVQFDWQSDSANLLINVGDKKPTFNDADIKKETRNDTLIDVTSEIKAIVKKNANKESIANTHLTIGVFTKNYESIFGTSYAFRVHLSHKLNIYGVNSDQKTLCKPEPIENNQYRCLYMITFGELDFIYDLMIYSRSQNQVAKTYMYGEFINQGIYDIFNEAELSKNIPNNKARFSTERDKIDYIFLTLSDLESHFYLSVVSDKQDIIELFTSFKTFDQEMSPNPSSIQLYSVNNAESITLKFITRKPLLINIVSLYGSSILYFEDEKEVQYALRGRDDRISLAIPQNNNQESYLVVKNTNYKKERLLLQDEQDKQEIEKPQIAFYIEYYVRSTELNLDEIYLGKTDEFAYKKSDFPLYYYSKIDENNLNSINIFFFLHDIEYGKVKAEMNCEDINIRGTIISQDIVYLVKVNEESKPNIKNSNIRGVYDPALQLGQVFFSSQDLKNANEKFPTIYLSLEKANQDFDVKKMRVELAAVQENGDVPVTEKIYQYGKVSDEKTINYYRLKVDNSTGDMRIQFSTNNKIVDFAINNEKNVKKNSTYENMEKKVERGKVFITFTKPKTDFIYLNVFLKNAPPNDRVNNFNYAFKYINSDSRQKFFEYKIYKDDSKLDLQLVDNEYIVKFNRIDKKNVNVTYSFKAVELLNYLNETFDTIALTESLANVSQFKKVNNQEEDKITLKLKKNKNEFKYFQVIAQINDGPITEYVAYNSIGQEFTVPFTKKSNKTGLYVIITFCVILLIVAIVLVVVVFFFNAKNKDLMNQVNKISFALSGAKEEEKDDGNLLMINETE